jgi:hypothetical protein
MQKGAGKESPLKQSPFYLGNNNVHHAETQDRGERIIFPRAPRRRVRNF